MDTKVKHCNFNKDNMTIEVWPDGIGCGDIISGGIYEIDLERCSNSAEVLDWIYQLFYKSWVDAELMMEFLECFNNACNEIHKQYTQAIFCPFGCSKTVNWNK